MSTNLVIALAVFLLTLVPAYIVWYVVRGRHVRRKKQRKEEDRKKAEGREKKKGKWGVDKDSYCYPSMNDVMGYDFINVVQVPEELKQDNNGGVKEEKTWDKSSGVGLTAVSHSKTSPERHGNEEEENEVYPSREGQPGGESNNDSKVDVSERDIKDFERLERLGGWISYDNHSETPTEEELMFLLDSNAGMVDDNPDMEEAARLQAEKEELDRFNQMNQRFINIDEGEFSSAAADVFASIGETVPEEDENKT